jgi:hypothetical protein
MLLVYYNLKISSKNERTVSQQAKEFLQLHVQEETIEEVRENRIQAIKQQEILISPLPSPSLFSNSDLFPGAATMQEIARYHKAAQKIANSYGSVSQWNREMHQLQQSLRYIQSSLPPSIDLGENSENLGNSQTSDEDVLDQDQHDHSSDDPLDDPSQQ